ncbi:GNAT family N-acetyltransferase [Paraburkholderia flava]|uniref:GNAT family N-acetyltransferase n=1 Tax=Paraburkholderia flava TaxID=2547393 RepID=UPI00105B8F5C|nr:GNAT family N-acetyltransferase [Paraburkholderia flava]
MTRSSATPTPSPFLLRELQRDELIRVWTIDRSEVIHHMYRLNGTQLERYPEFFDMDGWPEGEAEHYTPILLDCYDRGGWCAGLFDPDPATRDDNTHDMRLFGAAIVDSRRLGPAADMLQLKFLHVSCAYRGRGAGMQLYRAAQAHAASTGARRLYVSATGSEHTVDFYLAQGFTVSTQPDPELFALEPEDIHMEGPLLDSLKPY